MVKQVKHVVTILYQKDLMTFPFLLTYYKFVLNLTVYLTKLSFHHHLISVTPATSDMTPESRNSGATVDVHF
jgi:hypothetical protein